MSYPMLLKGGEVHDGTGRPPIETDVLIVGDRIAAVGGCQPPTDAETIDVTGLVVAPGFIDVHSHSDFTLLVDPRAMSSIMQGVTTEIVGNCGHGCAPFRNRRLGRIAVYGPVEKHAVPPETMGAYFNTIASVRPAVNVMSFVPNGQLRLHAIGVDQRPARQDEIAEMGRMLEEGLNEGAIGLSTGLEYAQEIGASEDEIVALARIAAIRGGLYATHTRDRDDGAIAAVAEAIRIARRADIPLQISHITPRGGMAATDACLEMVMAARKDGVPVEFDMHTRTFGFTHLKNLVSLADLQGDPDTVRSRFSDPGQRERMKTARNLITRCGWHLVCLARSASHPEFAGMTFEAIGAARGTDAHDAALDMLIADFDDLTFPMVTLQTYTEAQLRHTYLANRCMIGSDATALAPDGLLKDETFYGAYSWVSWFWTYMVRETRSFSRAEAIHRLTGLPAETFALRDRGQIAAGRLADIVAFDPERFTCHATLREPNRLASGIIELFVNGIHTISRGTATGRRGGRPLLRGG